MRVNWWALGVVVRLKKGLGEGVGAGLEHLKKTGAHTDFVEITHSVGHGSRPADITLLEIDH